MKKFHIFFVDDDEIFLTLIEKKFKQKPEFEVNLFQNGEDCLKNLHLNPDIIVLDYSLGKSGANGLEIFEDLKKYNYLGKVIFLSGQESGELVLDIVKKGVRDYIIKDRNLFQELEKVIEKYRAESN